MRVHRRHGRRATTQARAADPARRAAGASRAPARPRRPARKRRPSTPSRTISARPPWSLATTGRPARNASCTVSGAFSSQMDGTTSTSSAARTSRQVAPGANAPADDAVRRRPQDRAHARLVAGVAVIGGKRAVDRRATRAGRRAGGRPRASTCTPFEGMAEPTKPKRTTGPGASARARHVRPARGRSARPRCREHPARPSDRAGTREGDTSTSAARSDLAHLTEAVVDAALAAAAQPGQAGARPQRPAAARVRPPRRRRGVVATCAPTHPRQRRGAGPGQTCRSTFRSWPSGHTGQKSWSVITTAQPAPSRLEHDAGRQPGEVAHVDELGPHLVHDPRGRGRGERIAVGLEAGHVAMEVVERVEAHPVP